jgi:hypothetical protein
MGEWEKVLFNKIKNGEKLDYNELQCIERCLRMHSLYNDLLNTQIGVVPNKLKLEFADKYIPR